eukprot:s3542_g2.t1
MSCCPNLRIFADALKLRCWPWWPGNSRKSPAGCRGMCMGRDKWLGGELGEDGNVYGIPGSASRVLKIVPSTDQVELTGPEMLGLMGWPWGFCGD